MSNFFAGLLESLPSLLITVVCLLTAYIFAKKYNAFAGRIVVSQSHIKFVAIGVSLMWLVILLHDAGSNTNKRSLDVSDNGMKTSWQNHSNEGGVQDLSPTRRTSSESAERLEKLRQEQKESVSLNPDE